MTNQNETIDVPAVRERLRRELFDTVLPFWERYGIDHERGGFLHSLDYDGRPVSEDKFHWFQGRGLWLYSFLYNHFGGEARYLEIARRTMDFMLAHFPQPDGWWAAKVSREGRLVEPFQGDLYGMYFAAEGLQEYAWAARDERALDTARALLGKLWAHINRARCRRAAAGNLDGHPAHRHPDAPALEISRRSPKWATARSTPSSTAITTRRSG